MNKILIVDSSASDCRVMSSLLSQAGYDPVVSEEFISAQSEVSKLPPGAVILTAMRFPGGTARTLINWLKAENYKFPVIAIVDNFNASDILTVTEDGGASTVIQRLAIDKQLLTTVAKYARSESVALALGNILIPRHSDIWKQIENQIHSIALTNANAIIFGECGSGKEQIAHRIFELSSREQKPYTVVEAGGAELIGTHTKDSDRSELYGRIKSYFNESTGGTIIVKNVQLLSFEKQSVLLHILENEHSDVRVICTAEPHLKNMVAEKSFRSNLFYMLREAEICVPPLRDVTEDIPLIANYLLKIYQDKTGQPMKALDAAAIKALKLHPWYGNVRELKNVLQFAAFQAKGETISVSDLAIPESHTIPDDNLNRKNPRQEKENILKAYKRAGTWKGAATLLGISERALLELRKKFKISKNGELIS